MLWKGDQSLLKLRRKESLRGKGFQWESVSQVDNVAKETLAVSVLTSKPLETVAKAQRRKGRSSSPASHSKAKQTDGEGQTPSEESGNRDESLSYKRSKIPCRYRIAIIRHVAPGILP